MRKKYIIKEPIVMDDAKSCPFAGYSHNQKCHCRLHPDAVDPHFATITAECFGNLSVRPSHCQIEDFEE
jgi:hypothetical protein